ncbi:MAG: lipopolysaccharide biosynthesis protein [Sphingomonadaceae bacterium]
MEKRMHGLTTKDDQTESSTFRSKTVPDRALELYRRHRAFVLIVILPTLIAASYFFLIASDQYQSEAHFLVKKAERSAAPTSSFSQLVGMTGGSAGHAEAMSVSDYLTSHDAVAALQKSVDLISIFRRSEADIGSRLKFANPTPETLLNYYRDQVSVNYSVDTGITTLSARTFRPNDSVSIVQNLLKLGEKRVNALNERTLSDAVAVSQAQLRKAEIALAGVQGQLTRFRQAKRDIDPPSTGQVQSQLVSSLEAELAQANAQLGGMASHVRPDSPQYAALASRAAALKRQVDTQAGRLTGGAGTIAAELGTYEKLKLEQEFAANRYSAAAASLEKARDEAIKQQLFIVRVVEPNMPVKALYPERLKIVLTIFASLLLIYGIGWLIVAGVKEHAS